MTRAVGIMLVIPMAITWIRTHEWYELDLEWDQLYFKRPPWRPIWHALLAFTPLIVYLIWKFSYYGAMFDYVQTLYFGRAPLDLGKGFSSWALTLYGVVIGHAPGRPDLLPPGGFAAHYSIELVCSVIGLITILRCLKTDPEVAWFSLAAFLIAWVSGHPPLYAGGSGVIHYAGTLGQKRGLRPRLDSHQPAFDGLFGDVVCFQFLGSITSLCYHLQCNKRTSSRCPLGVRRKCRDDLA